jgi:hypothetical protein
LARHGGDEKFAKVVWERAQLETKEDYTFDSRFLFALFILDLQNANYPLKGNQLTLEQWQWVSELKSEFINYYSNKK